MTEARCASGVFARVRVLFALTVCAVAASLLTPASAFAVRKIGLSSGSFQFNVAPGQSSENSVYVINDGDEDLTVLVYAADQVVDKDGKVTYQVPSRNDPTAITSPASWLRLSMPDNAKAYGNTPYIEMKPGQRIKVEFGVEAPVNVAPGDHQVILFFEMFDLSSPKQGTATAKIAGRLGARLRVRVQGDLVDRLSVEPFVLRQLVVGESMPYTFRIKNEGNIDKRVTVKLTLLDSSKREVLSSTVLTEGVVYAGTESEHTGDLRPSEFLLGPYTGRLTMEYYKEGATPGQELPERVEEDRTVWAMPLWFAIAVISVIGVTLVWLSWRQAVKSAAKKAAKQTAAETDVVKPVAPQAASAMAETTAPAQPTARTESAAPKEALPQSEEPQEDSP